MDGTDDSSLDRLAEFKKSNSYGKRSSFPGTAMKNPNDIFDVFRGAMVTLQAMKIEEEQVQFYQPIDEKTKTEQGNTVKEKLHLPDLQDKLEQARSPRRRSFAAQTHIKNPRDTPVFAVEANPPSTRFWTHPAPPQHTSLPQINRTTNKSKNAYAKSCIDGPHKSKPRREERVKRTRSKSLIFPCRPTTFGESLQAKWYNGKYSWRRRSKARASWKIKLHERKQPHFSS